MYRKFYSNIKTLYIGRSELNDEIERVSNRLDLMPIYKYSFSNADYYPRTNMAVSAVTAGHRPDGDICSHNLLVEFLFSIHNSGKPDGVSRVHSRIVREDLLRSNLLRQFRRRLDYVALSINNEEHRRQSET